MKKRLSVVLFVLLGAILCILLCGCNESVDQPPDNTTADTGTTAEEDPKTPLEQFWEDTIKGMDNYCIIVSQEISGNDIKLVQAFSGAVANLTNKYVTVYTDNRELPENSTGELIFGITNRLGSRYQSEVDDSKIGSGKFVVEYIGKDMIVHYSDVFGLYAAVQKLLSYVAPEDTTSLRIEAVFASNLKKTGFNIGSLKLKNVYTDNMLLQQNRPVLLSGRAEPNYPLTVKLILNDNVVTETTIMVPENGKWSLEFDAPAGSYDKYSIAFYFGTIQALELKNIVFGEFWLATGQSNMAYTLAKDADYSSQTFDDEFIRVLYASRPSEGYSSTPLAENSTAHWYAGDDPSSMTNSTAVGYYFAKKLRAELDMPVGLLFYAVGGTPIRSWLSSETIDNDADLKQTYLNKGTYVPTTNWDTSAYRQMSALYNTFTSPLRGFSIGGVIWYQGEQDEAEIDRIYSYELSVLHKQYCDEFGYPDGKLPFIISMLMPYYSTRDPLFFADFAYDMASFYEGREDYVSIIPIYDASPEFNADNNASHPKSKLIAGTRMGNAALALISDSVTYPSSAPYAESFEIRDGAVFVTFSNIADGLCILPDKGDTAGETPLRGFTICGADGVFIMADAEIVGKNQVKIWHDEITAPVAAAYGYSLLQFYCNLGCSFNGTLLYPAVPFRSSLPDNAKQLTYLPWTDCDYEQLWRITRVSVHYGAFYDAWTTANGNGVETTLSYDKAVKYNGTASLKLDYTGTGSFRLIPVTSGKTVDGSNANFLDGTSNFSAYNKLTFYVRNDGAGAVSFDSTIINLTLFARLAANSDCADGIIPADGQWHKLTVDLSKLYRSSGTQLENASSYLTAVTTLQFVFNGTSAGTLHFDEVELLP